MIRTSSVSSKGISFKEVIVMNLKPYNYNRIRIMDTPDLNPPSTGGGLPNFSHSVLNSRRHSEARERRKQSRTPFGVQSQFNTSVNVSPEVSPRNNS